MEKKKELRIINCVKSPHRLGSLSNPRDLSLGGTKQKKLYVPNLNAVRAKNKTKDIVNKLSQERIKKEHRDKPKDRINAARYVQSRGVFSEGASSGTVKRSTSNNHQVDESANHISTISVPKINKANWQVDKKFEKETIDGLLNCENDSSDSDSDYEPVILQLDSKDSLTKKLNIKKEPSKIKQEFNDQTILNYDQKLFAVKQEGFNSTPANMTIFGNNKIYNDENVSYSLVKMPDTFAAKGFHAETEELVDFTMKHMHEGQIGKIIIRESGKIDVYIGNTLYVLDAEKTPNFLEEIMIMPDQSESYTDPLMGRVGSITDRFVLSPNWTNLFLNFKTK